MALILSGKLVVSLRACLPPLHLPECDPDAEREAGGVGHLLPEELRVLPGAVALPASQLRRQTHRRAA